MPSSTKSAIIHVRVTPRLKSRIRAAAKKDKRRVSAWVALLLERALADVIGGAP